MELTSDLRQKTKFAFRRPLGITYVIMLCVACFYLIHSTIVIANRYVFIYAWMDGHERLPFQKRKLILPLLRWASTSPTIKHVAQHLNHMTDPLLVMMWIVDFFALLGCALIATLLYDAASKDSRLRWAPSALTVAFYTFTAVMRYEHRFIFPYDMLGMFFFTLGIYLIYKNWLWALVILMPIATYNRETTLLWVPLILLAGQYLATRSSEPRKVWLRSGLAAAAIVVIWVAIEHHLQFEYRFNNKSEDYPRFWENILTLMQPTKWDETLSPFAFSLPFLAMLFPRVKDGLLRKFFWIVPIWIVVMFYQAIIFESRIFDELCPYMAVMAVLIFESTYMEPQDHAGGDARIFDELDIEHGQTVA
jgi:hypothetical protein